MTSTTFILVLIFLGLAVGLSISLAAKLILDEVAKEKPANEPE